MEQNITLDYLHVDALEELDTEDKMLVHSAINATQMAYAPYSNFRVGAAARLESGAIISASNQESEVFPAGVCAERNLLQYHGANYANDPIVALAVVSDREDKECFPCGICRQVLCDSEKRQGCKIRIIMASHRSATVVDTAKKLLPFTFEL